MPELCVVVTFADIERLCKVAAKSPDQDEFFLDAELVPLVGNSKKENMPTFQDLPDPRAEIDMFDVIAAKVRAGEPLHVFGQLEGTIGKLHIETINRLLAEPGLSVTVVHSAHAARSLGVCAEFAMCDDLALKERLIRRNFKT